MNKFKVGDKVLCVNSSGAGYENNLLNNEIYIITHVDDDFVKIKQIPDYFLLSKRFVSAEKYLAEQTFNKKFEDFIK